MEKSRNGGKLDKIYIASGVDKIDIFTAFNECAMDCEVISFIWKTAGVLYRTLQKQRTGIMFENIDKFPLKIVHSTEAGICFVPME